MKRDDHAHGPAIPEVPGGTVAFRKISSSIPAIA
jgi:hypothetical protein